MTETQEIRDAIGEFHAAITEVRDWRKKADDEIKKSGAATAATIEKLTTLETSLADAGKKMTDLVAAATARIDKHEEDIRVLKQKGLRLGGDGPVLEARSFGQRLIESDAYKAAQFNGRFKFQTTIGGRLFERKATITEGGSGWVIFPQRVGVVMATPQLPLVMRDLLDVVGLTGTNAVEYVIETWNYAADYQVAEGDKKAQGDVTYTDATAVVRTIAWFVKVSRQMLADVAYVAQTIDQRLIYGVLKKEDYEILWGTGAAGHLKGIMPQATLHTVTAGTSRIDEILSAMATLAAQGYAPSATVMNPMDFAGLLTAKAPGGGTYLLGGPLVSEPNRLWGIPVAQTMNMTLGNYLVGAFPGNATLFDRETATSEISYENEDDFVRNLATIRAEERVALAVFTPAAFRKGVFAATGPNIVEETAAPPVHASGDKRGK